MKKFDPKKISKRLLDDLGLELSQPIQIQRQKLSKNRRCLDNVENYISLCGGKVQYGWLLTVIGNIVLQLTGHAVVNRVEDGLLCVTLSEDRRSTVKFAPDNTIGSKLIDDYLPCKYVPLINDEKLSEYLALLREHDRLRISGKSSSSWEVLDVISSLQLIYPEILNLAKKHTGRNDLCFCGSRIKSKFCCG